MLQPLAPSARRYTSFLFSQKRTRALSRHNLRSLFFSRSSGPNLKPSPFPSLCIYSPLNYWQFRRASLGVPATRHRLDSSLLAADKTGISPSLSLLFSDANIVRFAANPLLCSSAYTFQIQKSPSHSIFYFKKSPSHVRHELSPWHATIQG